MWTPYLCVHPLFQLLMPSYVLPHYCKFSYPCLCTLFVFSFSLYLMDHDLYKHRYYCYNIYGISICVMYMCQFFIDEVLLYKKMNAAGFIDTGVLYLYAS